MYRIVTSAHNLREEILQWLRTQRHLDECRARASIPLPRILPEPDASGCNWRLDVPGGALGCPKCTQAAIAWAAPRFNIA